MESRQAGAPLAAYCCAILAGLVILDITVLTTHTAIPFVLEEMEFSWENLRREVVSMMPMFTIALIVGFPVSLFAASPFMALFLAAAGKFWPISQKSCVIYGSIIPGFITLIFISIFEPPPIGAIKPTGNWPIDYWPLGRQSVNSFMDYALSMLNFIILAMPSGAVAGHLFWRMGFCNEALHQQKMNAKT